eukprot:4516388-Pyramimonas_sp.AAC.2
MDASQIVIETGSVAKLANGAAMVMEGETVLLTTACYDDAITGDGSFTPLMIVYSERQSAGGKTAYVLEILLTLDIVPSVSPGKLSLP